MTAYCQRDDQALPSRRLGRKIPADEFLRLREEVLQTWPTGAAVHLEEAIKYQQAIPAGQAVRLAMRDVMGRGRCWSSRGPAWR